MAPVTAPALSRLAEDQPPHWDADLPATRYHAPAGDTAHHCPVCHVIHAWTPMPGRCEVILERRVQRLPRYAYCTDQACDWSDSTGDSTEMEAVAHVKATGHETRVVAGSRSFSLASATRR